MTIHPTKRVGLWCIKHSLWQEKLRSPSQGHEWLQYKRECYIGQKELYAFLPFLLDTPYAVRKTWQSLARTQEIR